MNQDRSRVIGCILFVCVQVERESYPLGSAVQAETRDHGEVPESGRRQISPAIGQRERRCQVHGLLLQVL